MKYTLEGEEVENIISRGIYVKYKEVIEADAAKFSDAIIRFTVTIKRGRPSITWWIEEKE